MRLQRAQAVPAAQRTPEVAAFIEAMQLDEEVCELLPLAAGAGGNPQPALPLNTAAAERRVLLAIISFSKMKHVASSWNPPSFKGRAHLSVYLAYGCSERLPPLAHCISAAERRLLLRHNSNAQDVGCYLWLFAVADFCPVSLLMETVKALEQLGDALGAADQESLDQQLRQLQGDASTAGSGLLVTSKQLQWICFLGMYYLSANIMEPFLMQTDSERIAEANRVKARGASMMVQLEPGNPFSRAAASGLSVVNPSNDPARATGEAIQLELRACEEAKRQHRYLRAISPAATQCL